MLKPRKPERNVSFDISCPCGLNHGESYNGNRWPHEDGIKAILEKVFKTLGIEINTIQLGNKPGIDLTGRTEDGRDVLCEAKGEPPCVNTKGKNKNNPKTLDEKNNCRTVNFKELVGTIIERMETNDAKKIYVIAVPDTPEFHELVKTKIPDWIRQCLRIHALFVKQDGKVTYLCPSQSNGDIPENLKELSRDHFFET